MRFNDLVETVLATRTDSDRARAVLWRQCIDLLAQLGDTDSSDDDAQREAVATTLERIGAHVPMPRKLAAIAELGGRLRSSRLVGLLARDSAPVVAATLRVARLSDTAWTALIPTIGPLGRSILRDRADMGEGARAVLEAFGPHDLTLTDSRVAGEASSAADGIAKDDRSPGETRPKSQIRAIVDRIEQFTSGRREREPVSAGTSQTDQPPKQVHEAAAAFDFVTDATGRIVDGSAENRSFLVGLMLGEPGLDAETGPDGQILGAFRRRGAVRDGRLAIADGVFAGHWLVTAQPRFDERLGRFLGYRGTARRAQARDRAPRTPDSRVMTEGDASSLRQLVHELRTPLNGVMGFAELIEREYFGSVDPAYRGLASNIVDDVRRLVEVLDDLDLANRDILGEPVSGQSDCVALLREAITLFAVDVDGHQRIRLDSTARAPVPLATTADIAGRAIRHIVRALAACADAPIDASVELTAGMVRVGFSLPTMLAALDEETLFDPGHDMTYREDVGPALGIGFALRLARKIATAVGGALGLEGHRLLLRLPAGDAERDGVGRTS